MSEISSLAELADEFLGPVEGELTEGSLVFRPSGLAAVSAVTTVLGGLLLTVGPFLLANRIAGGDAPDVGSGAADMIGGIIDGIGGIILVGGALLPLLQILFTRYVLDDEGIRIHVQLLNRTERRVPWEKVTALRHRRTVVDRLLGIERLDVIAYGERGATLHLVGLRQAASLRDHVATRMRRTASVGALLRAD